MAKKCHEGATHAPSYLKLVLESLFYSCCPPSKSGSFHHLLRNIPNHGHFLRLQNGDTVQTNPGIHSYENRSEMHAVPTELYIITVMIVFPQPNSAALKSPAFREAVAKEYASKEFFP